MIRRRRVWWERSPDGNSALMLVCARLRHVAGTQRKGQQEVHEYEPSGGGFERRPYCRLTSFSRSLQTILCIILDSTPPRPNVENSAALGGYSTGTESHLLPGIKNTTGDFSLVVEQNYIYYVVSNKNHCCCFLFVFEKQLNIPKGSQGRLMQKKSCVEIKLK